MSKLKSLHSSDWEKCTLSKYTKHLVDHGWWTVTALSTRPWSPAELTAIVYINPSYPTTTPVFCLSLQLDSNTETQET